jgi:hypothetical protein
MSRIDEIIAKQKALADELELAKQEERDAVLKDIKEKIKLFGFKTTDFKGVLATRKKRGTAILKKAATKRTVK